MSEALQPVVREDGAIDFEKTTKEKRAQIKEFATLTKPEMIDRAMDLQFSPIHTWNAAQIAFWTYLCKYKPEIREHVENQFPPDSD